ncbi:Serine/Threonine Kinase and Pseudokinase [Abortiporus biennis]
MDPFQQAYLSQLSPVIYVPSPYQHFCQVPQPLGNIISISPPYLPQQYSPTVPPAPVRPPPLEDCRPPLLSLDDVPETNKFEKHLKRCYSPGLGQNSRDVSRWSTTTGGRGEQQHIESQSMTTTSPYTFASLSPISTTDEELEESHWRPTTVLERVITEIHTQSQEGFSSLNIEQAQIALNFTYRLFCLLSEENSTKCFDNPHDSSCRKDTQFRQVQFADDLEDTFWSFCGLVPHFLSDTLQRRIRETVSHSEGNNRGRGIQHRERCPHKAYEVDEDDKKLLHQAMTRLVNQHHIIPGPLRLNGVMLVKNETYDSGGFGDIYLGQYQDKLVAVKCIRYNRAIESEEQHKKYLKYIVQEAMLWANLKHEHVLPFLGIDWFQIKKKSPSIITPWMKNGQSFVTRINLWLFQISLGLKYLHKQGIIHGDLHGKNVLISDNWDIQLADFGSSVVAEAHGDNYSSVRTGARKWRAPEILIPESETGHRHEDTKKLTRLTKASDIYSFACICIELYTRRPPWHQFPEYLVIIKLLNKERPERPSRSELDPGVILNDELWSIVQDCWDDDVRRRPSARKLVERMERLRYSGR